MESEELTEDSLLKRTGELLDRLRRQIKGLDERQMRLSKFVLVIKESPPELSLSLIFELFRRAAWGNYDYKEFFYCFLYMDEIVERLGNRYLSELYLLARQSENSLVARLLVAPRNSEEYKAQLHPDLKEVTLGERRQWAKEFHPQRLELLMKDVDERVMSNLLSNPKILEQHVLKIITQRPCAPSVLKATALHYRWNLRSQVREAIVLNPWTPFDISLPLLPLFNRKEIKKLRGDPALKAELRTAIDEINKLKIVPEKSEELELENENPET